MSSCPHVTQTQTPLRGCSKIWLCSIEKIYGKKEITGTLVMTIICPFPTLLWVDEWVTPVSPRSSEQLLQSWQRIGLECAYEGRQQPEALCLCSSDMRLKVRAQEPHWYFFTSECVCRWARRLERSAKARLQS